MCPLKNLAPKVKVMSKIGRYPTTAKHDKAQTVLVTFKTSCNDKCFKKTELW